MYTSFHHRRLAGAGAGATGGWPRASRWHVKPLAAMTGSVITCDIQVLNSCEGHGLLCQLQLEYYFTGARISVK